VGGVWWGGGGGGGGLFCLGVGGGGAVVGTKEGGRPAWGTVDYGGKYKKSSGDPIIQTDAGPQRQLFIKLKKRKLTGVWQTKQQVKGQIGKKCRVGHQRRGEDEGRNIVCNVSEDKEQ